MEFLLDEKLLLMVENGEGKPRIWCLFVGRSGKENREILFNICKEWYNWIFLNIILQLFI
jgi:hypothetical protein